MHYPVIRRYRINAATCPLSVKLGTASWTPTQSNEACHLPLQALPLFYSPIKGDSEITYSEVIPSNLDTDYDFDEDEIELIVDKIVEYIKPKYRDMVEEWIYSVLAGVKVTQKELGRKYNLCQAQIARVLASAVNIMKMHGEEIRDLFGI